MDQRTATAYNAHKCMVYLDSLARNNHDDLSDKERVGVKQALAVATKIYKRRQASEPAEQKLRRNGTQI